MKVKKSVPLIALIVLSLLLPVISSYANEHKEPVSMPIPGGLWIVGWINLAVTSKETPHGTVHRVHFTAHSDVYVDVGGGPAGDPIGKVIHNRYFMWTDDGSVDTKKVETVSLKIHGVKPMHMKYIFIMQNGQLKVEVGTQIGD